MPRTKKAIQDYRKNLWWKRCVEMLGLEAERSKCKYIVSVMNSIVAQPDRNFPTDDQRSILKIFYRCLTERKKTSVERQAEKWIEERQD